MSPLEICQRCADGIAEARRAVAAAEFVDLAGLDEEVMELCATLPSLPVEERPAMRAALAALVGELDALTAALDHQQQQLREAEAGQQRERAAQAYKAAPGGRG
jgi:hypothetical protein